MSPLPPIGIQITTQLVQAIFYGIYVVTLGACLKSLFRSETGWKTYSEISKPMVVVAFLMGFFATFDLFLGYATNLNALLFNGPGGPDAGLEQISDWISVMGIADLIAQIILGDGMLLYRCWIVYSRSWSVMALPFTLAIAGLVTSGLCIYYECTLSAGHSFTNPYKGVQEAAWAITICLNVLTTSLIVYRIRHQTLSRIGNNSFGSDYIEHQSSYKHAMRIIIESGLMYTIVATMTAIAYITDSDATFPLSGIDIEMIGIAFNLIIIRVQSRRNHEIRDHKARPAASSLRFGSMARDVATVAESEHSGVDNPSEMVDQEISDGRVDDKTPEYAGSFAEEKV